MRIISGSAGGRKLKSPKDNSIRPTTDRVKEAIFNIISYKIQDSYVLDIFAGTGSLGFECLSRGAESAIFIDKDDNSNRIIKENANILGYSDRIKIIKSDYKTILNKLCKKFDIIICDPPYMKNYEMDLLERISKIDILACGGVIIIEHSKKTDIINEINGIYKWKEKKYGDTKVSIFKKEEDLN